MNIHNLRLRKTLIVGGVKSGKTLFVSEFVTGILHDGRESLLVLDFAPSLYQGVGGKMELPEHPRLCYETVRIDAPRLRGKDDAERASLAVGNCGRIEALLDACAEQKADVLVINDVTLYLQGGHHERLSAFMTSFPTVLINAYYGTDFSETRLSIRERDQVHRFMKAFDQVLFMEAGRIVGPWPPSWS